MIRSSTRLNLLILSYKKFVGCIFLVKHLPSERKQCRKFMKLEAAKKLY